MRYGFSSPKRDTALFLPSQRNRVSPLRLLVLVQVYAPKPGF